MNLLLGLFLRESDQHCEDNRLINKGTYGSRANRCAIDSVVIDVTQIEYSIVTRTPLVRFINNVTACFDRIMPHLLSLYLCEFQISKKFISILGILLEGAQYAIKSTRKYQKTSIDTPFTLQCLDPDKEAQLQQ